MTTIVYDHKDKLVAYDGMVCDDHQSIMLSENKATMLSDGSVLFSAGELNAIKLVEQKWDVLIKGEGVGGYALMDTCTWLRWDGEQMYLGELATKDEETFYAYEHPINESTAIGSGSPHALTFIDVWDYLDTSKLPQSLSSECMAYAAVEFAAQRDKSTGGLTQVYAL